MHPKEFAAVMKMTPLGRYEYFVKRAADQQELWSLWDEGWALLGDKEQGGFVPIWPHPDFAKAYANGEWSEYLPKSIHLDDWLEKWMSGMLRDHRNVAVFPVPGEKHTRSRHIRAGQ
jgi:hypothetical protein